MTNKLVNEINYHMKSVTRPISRISFIGHSLGCILIRWGHIKYKQRCHSASCSCRSGSDYPFQCRSGSGSYARFYICWKNQNFFWCTFIPVPVYITLPFSSASQDITSIFWTGKKNFLEKVQFCFLIWLKWKGYVSGSAGPGCGVDLDPAK